MLTGDDINDCVVTRLVLNYYQASRLRAGDPKADMRTDRLVCLFHTSTSLVNSKLCLCLVVEGMGN